MKRRLRASLWYLYKIGTSGGERMSEEKKPVSEAKVDRRDLVKKGLKAAYMVPAILAAVKATERPAYGQFSGEPVPQIP